MSAADDISTSLGRFFSAQETPGLLLNQSNKATENYLQVAGKRIDLLDLEDSMMFRQKKIRQVFLDKNFFLPEMLPPKITSHREL